MKNLLMNIFFLWLSCYVVAVNAVSVVYNVRMAEITKRQASSLKNSVPYIASFTLFDQARERCDCMRENSVGGLGSFLYLSPSFYAKIDGAFGHVRQKKDDFYFSRTQLDDILLSAGYGFEFNKKTKISLTGFLGLPTHADLSPQGIQFGTGHYGLGLQVDGSYKFSSANVKHAFMGAARLIHYFPRNVRYTLNGLSLPFRFNIGNLTDVLVAYSCGTKKHGIEVGYNASIISNTTLWPLVTSILEQLSYKRNTVYLGYRYLMRTKHHRTGISCALSYGQDHHPTLLGMKRVVTAWGAWGINF